MSRPTTIGRRKSSATRSCSSTRCEPARASRSTDSRAGATLGAETSIDKVLVATAEQVTYDAVRRLLPGAIEMDDSGSGEVWRSEYLYSRAATIYGGTAEVQRNIIARRLLDLGSAE